MELVCPRFFAQLLHRLHHLIQARGADGMPTGLQAPHGADGNAPLQGDRALQGQGDPATSRSEPRRLQREGRHDGESIVQLEKVNILWSHSGLGIGPLRGKKSRLQKKRIPAIM